MKYTLKEIPYLGGVLIIMGILPFILYFFGPYFGGSELRYGTGYKHGPWRQTYEAYTIGYPLLFIFLPVNFIFLIVRYIQKKHHLVKSLFIIMGVAAFLIYIQLHFLFWLID